MVRKSFWINSDILTRVEEYGRSKTPIPAFRKALSQLLDKRLRQEELPKLITQELHIAS
jgi:hypothetical protein